MSCSAGRASRLAAGALLWGRLVSEGHTSRIRTYLPSSHCAFFAGSKKVLHVVHLVTGIFR